MAVSKSANNDAARRLLFTLAQLDRREMLFVQAIFDGKTVWDAAQIAGYRRCSGRIVAMRIARKHPEFAELAAAVLKPRYRPRKKSGTLQPPPQ